MHRVVFVAVVAGALLGITGCNAYSREAQLRQLLSVYNEVADVLSHINPSDEATVTAAIPELKKLTARISDIEENLAAKDKPSEEVSVELHKRFDEEIDNTVKRFVAEMNRLTGINNLGVAGNFGITLKQKIEGYLQPPIKRTPIGGMPAPGPRGGGKP
jgi:hypothetical protein